MQSSDLIRATTGKHSGLELLIPDSAATSPTGRESGPLSRNSLHNTTPGSSRLSSTQLPHAALLRQRSAKFVDHSPTGRYSKWPVRLGSGAHKVVWKGWDSADGKEVAWNEVPFTTLPAFELERLHTEVDILKSIRHPNLIAIEDTWSTEDAVVFITPFCPSGDLREFIRSHSPVKLKVLKRIWKQILEGLKYLHSQRPVIIHRDIKCENILYDVYDGTVKIGDLGLAKQLLPESQRGSGECRMDDAMWKCVGTPAFMAPEMYCDYYDETVDVYAFGMCVLEMVTQRLPYEECQNACQVYRAVNSGTLPKSLADVTLPSLKDFILLCIQRRPDGTRPSVADVLASEFLTVPNPTEDYMDITSAGSDDEEDAVDPEDEGYRYFPNPHDVSPSSTTPSYRGGNGDASSTSSMQEQPLLPTSEVSPQVRTDELLPPSPLQGARTLMKRSRSDSELIELHQASKSTPGQSVSVAATFSVNDVQYVAHFDFDTVNDAPQSVAWNLASRIRTEWGIRVDDAVAIPFLASVLSVMRYQPHLVLQTGPLASQGWDWVRFVSSVSSGNLTDTQRSDDGSSSTRSVAFGAMSSPSMASTDAVAMSPRLFAAAKALTPLTRPLTPARPVTPTPAPRPVMKPALDTAQRVSGRGSPTPSSPGLSQPQKQSLSDFVSAHGPKSQPGTAPSVNGGSQGSRLSMLPTGGGAPLTVAAPTPTATQPPPLSSASAVFSTTPSHVISPTPAPAPGKVTDISEVLAKIRRYSGAHDNGLPTLVSHSPLLTTPMHSAPQQPFFAVGAVPPPAPTSGPGLKPMLTSQPGLVLGTWPGSVPQFPGSFPQPGIVPGSSRPFF